MLNKLHLQLGYIHKIVRMWMMKNLEYKQMVCRIVVVEVVIGIEYIRKCITCITNN